MIAIDQIAKNFGEYPALHGVDLHIERGEFIALLGPSGSGKTTLLRIIAGLEHQDAGRVLFEGEDVSETPVAERGVGFVFQHYALFRHMSVADNVGFGLSVRRRKSGLSRAAIRDKAKALLGMVQLDGLGDRYPAQLSGGQRQRVALARALAIEPRLLLLDEPFGALDARVRKDLRRALRDLHRRMGLTSIFVTHDQEEALELADRVVVMNQGRIEQVGTPEEVYTRPATPFVASFVGETNALPAALFGDRTVTGDTLHLRPHELAIVTPDTSGAHPVTVSGAFRKGGFWRIEAALAGDDAIVEIDLDASIPPPAPGDIVHIRAREPSPVSTPAFV